MQRGVRTGLFHAIVGLGLASCGGLKTSSTPTDAASPDASFDGAATSDATMFQPDSGAPDATTDGALASSDAADDAFEALDAELDSGPDVRWVAPVQ